MAKRKSPSKGIGGWLGRQVGHVRKAVNTKVEPKTVYRRQTVQQTPLAPNVLAKRTVTDEVIVRGENK